MQKLVKFKDVELHIVEDGKHGFLLSTREVAAGYGVSESVIRSHKSNQADELVEGKHFLRVQNMDAQNLTGNKMVREVILWTKRGIVRLGFFIKSQRAKEFRDWAEDYIVDSNKPSAITPKTSGDIRTKYLSPSVMRELKGIVSKEALDEFYQREVLGLPSVRASGGGCIFRPSERSWDILVSEYEKKGMRIPPKDLSQWRLEDKTAFYREFKGHDATILSILGVWNWLHGFESDPKPIYFDVAAAERRMKEAEAAKAKELAAKL